MTRYKVTVPTRTDWEGALCGGLSATGVEKMKARILRDYGYETVWEAVASTSGYWVSAVDLLSLLP